MARSFVRLIIAGFLISRPAYAGAFPPDYRFSLDVGYQNLNYTEIHPFQPAQTTNGFIQNSIVFDAEFLYYLISHLNSEMSRYEGDLAFYADVAYSAVPVSSNLSGTNAEVLRFNARLGIPIPILNYPWSLNLMGGFYQTDMWVTNHAFGYQKLTGPEIYPMLHWSRFTDKAVLTDISAFFKYSPLTDGTTPFSFSNREVAFGFAARFPVTSEFVYLKQGWERAFTVKASYSELENIFEIVRDVNVTSRIFTLTIGYDF